LQYRSEWRGRHAIPRRSFTQMGEHLHAPTAPISKFQSAFVGFVRGREEERVEQAHLEHPPVEEFQEIDTSSALSKYSLIIVSVYLAAGVTFFSWAEDWPWDDALYFCVVTMTTVGYGDLVPTTDMSKIFAVFYIVFGLSFAATCLGLVVAHIQGYVDSMMTKIPRKDRHFWQIVTSLTTISILIGVGATFVYWFEGWEPVDAIYWAVVTSSSVGYGDLTIESQETRWFNTVYMLFAVGGFAVSLSKFGTIIMEVEAERAINEFVTRGVSEAMIEEMDEDKSGSVDKAEFLRYMLITMGKVDPEDLDKILGMFEQLDADGSGSIDRDDILRELSLRSASRSPGGKASPAKPYKDKTGRGSALESLKALAKPLLGS